MSNLLTFSKVNFSRVVAFFIAVGILLPIFCAASPQQKALFDLLDENGVTDIKISSNFDSIMGNIRNKEYEPGTMQVKLGKKEFIDLNLKIRPRGKSRRMMCDFPPLKLKFEKKSLKKNGIEKFNDFKLVTHCVDNDESSETNLFREYLVYKLYNVLTPYSFKASLVKITYENQGNSFRKLKQWGIIIEDSESLASRNNGYIIERMGIPLDSIHPHQEKMTCMFQYMIGNADWSYLMARNMEFVMQGDSSVVPVPYDFDYSGLVSAPYARADATLGQTSVRDRVFRGIKCTYVEMTDMISYFQSKKEEILSTVNDFKKLDPMVRKDMKDYIKSFYDIIESEERFNNELLANPHKD